MGAPNLSPSYYWFRLWISHQVRRTNGHGWHCRNPGFYLEGSGPVWSHQWFWWIIHPRVWRVLPSGYQVAPVYTTILYPRNSRSRWFIYPHLVWVHPHFDKWRWYLNWLSSSNLNPSPTRFLQWHEDRKVTCVCHLQQQQQLISTWKYYFLLAHSLGKFVVPSLPMPWPYWDHR